MPDESNPPAEESKPDSSTAQQGQVPQGDVVIVGPRAQIHIEQGGDKKDGDKKEGENGDKKGGDDKKNGKEKKKFKWTPLKIILLVLVVLAIVIVAVIYILYALAHEETDDAYTTGYVHQISSRVTSNVIELDIVDNEFVHQGQVLVRLDPRDFQVIVDKAQSDYDRAQADFARENQLLKSGAVSQQEYDQVKATLGVTKSALDDAKNQLSYSTIVAPEDGIVGNKTVETGNRLAQSTVLMSVVQEVWVVANYKETQVGQMVPGQEVNIRVDEIPGHTFTGRVDSLSPGSGSTFALLPPQNATGNFTKIVQRVPVKIRFDLDSMRGYEKRLVPGLSVETDVAMTAPVSATQASAEGMRVSAR
jgi:membrane fusion protein (multidrug efflux system)